MRTPKIKYLLCPGMVTSATDGQRHYIGPYHLAQLYRVAPAECRIYQPEPWWPASYYESAEREHAGLIKLEPRYDGDYRLERAQSASQPPALPTETN